jgi:hypothetical protein
MDKIRLLTITLLICLTVFLLNCSNEPKGTDNTEVNLPVENDNNLDQLGETFYQIPSPEELFAFVQGGNLSYKASLLNPIDNAKKYTDVKSKELNFGVYIADLAYAAAFSRYQESLKNIESVRKLSDEIGISSVFDEALNNRIQHIFENSDSLLNVTNTSYYKIVTYLEENERGKTLALISAGGWVESMYIFTNLVEKYSPDNPTIQRIADQKLTFDNLIQYLMKHESDPNVKQTINDFKGVQEAFSQLEEVQVSTNDLKNKKDNVFVVGGGKRINISEPQFTNLKQKIAETRNKITANI